MAKILVLDDDLSLRGVFNSAFNGLFEVLWAENVEEAVYLLQTESPEVIIIDRYLEGVESGIQLVVEDKVGDASCILITASNPTPEFRADMLSLGFLYVMTKPFSVQEMKAIVNRALSHWNTKNGYTMNMRRNTGTIEFPQSSLDKLRNAASAFKMAVGT
jgi:DNA-binding response OmpR family regulator